VKITFIAIISIVLSVAAQFALKTGMSGSAAKTVVGQPYELKALFVFFTDKYIFGGFVLYGIGAVLWLGVLSKWDVSKAYPLVGIGFILTAIIGYALGEHLTMTRVSGVALICAGVFLVGQS